MLLVFCSSMVCVNYNCTTHAEDGTPWLLSHEMDFSGEIFPFGCLAHFVKSHAQGETGRWEPKGDVVVFAGYRVQHGYKWNHEYLAWELTRFRKGNLRVSAGPDLQDMGMPRITNVCTLAGGKLTFPLKADYERVSQDIEDPRLAPGDEDNPLMLAPEDRRVRGLALGEQYVPQGAFENPEEWRHVFHGEEEEVLQEADARVEGIFPSYPESADRVALEAHAPCPLLFSLRTWGSSVCRMRGVAPVPATILASSPWKSPWQPHRGRKESSRMWKLSPT